MNLYQYKNRFEVAFKKQLRSDLDTVKNLDLERKVKIDNNTFPIDEGQFYYPKSSMYIKFSNNRLQGHLGDNDYKNIYLSYGTLNNNFKNEPEKSLIDLNTNKNYNFHIELDTSGDIEIIPLIIHYSNGQKIKQTRITENGQSIKFGELENKCRLTFKVVGHGDFYINRISIF